MRTVILVSAFLMAGCTASSSSDSEGNAALPTVSNAANITAPIASEAKADSPDRWLGRWTGVEGMYLLVGRGEAAGQYTLEMQWDLDHKGQFDGMASGDAITFKRGGKALRLRPSDGYATGLKYLAGKRDCLTVAPGEGYCRN